MKSAVKIALAVALLLIAAQMVLGSSIITMPTADVAPVGLINLAAYSVNFDGMVGPSTGMGVYIAYAGIAKNLELEANVYDLNKGGDTWDFYVLTYQVVQETDKMPKISVGAKNFLGETIANGSTMNDDPTFFVAAVKTVMAPAPGEPFSPVIRLHAGYGDNLHNGLFGGVQAMLTPQIGVAALNDAKQSLYAVTYKPYPEWPTFKAGTLGKHTWVGVDYDLKF
ncbi:MAG: hypothetical protein KBC96_10945 [Armatimonadetes bacterium]|nr:hypothetical protein [Armatimonadota bacterium]